MQQLYWNTNCSNLGVLGVVRSLGAALAALVVLGEFRMTWLLRTLRLPAAESQTNFVLAVCILLLGFMTVALVWQAQIIADQRAVIRFLVTAKLGG